MKTGSVLLLAGAGLAAWLLLSRKDQSEGGTGGSLDIPAMFGMGSSGGDPTSSGPQPVAFQISDKIAAAIAVSPSQGSTPVGGFSQLSYRAVNNFFTPSKEELSQSFIPQAGQSFSTPSAKKIANLYPSSVSIISQITGDYSSQGGGNYSGISPNATGHVSGRNIEHWEGLSSEAIYGFRPFSGDTSEVGGAKKQLQAHYGNTIDIQQTGTFFKAIPKKAVS